MGTILSLNQPIGSRLIRILYCVALVLIALGVLRGIVGGVLMMTHPMPPAGVTMPASVAMPAGPDAAPPPASRPMPMRSMPMYGPGPRHWRRGPGGGHIMMGPLRHLPAPARGGLRILLALLRGAIVLMIVRVLAEIGTAILAMGARQTGA